MNDTTSSNYEVMHENHRKIFLSYDQESMIRHYHLDHDENHIYFKTLNMDWILDRETGVITCQDEPVNWDGANAVYDLLGHAGNNPAPAGEWTSIVKFGGTTAIGHLERLKSGNLYADFAGRMDALETIMKEFGGTPEGKGDISYRLSFFPSFDILFQVWDADDEFPVSVTYLFDTNADRFMHYETMWYVMNFVESEIRKRLQ